MSLRSLRLPIALTALVLVLSACAVRQPAPQHTPPYDAPSRVTAEPPQLPGPPEEPELRTLVESTIPSVTTVAHYFAPKMFDGPDGPFGTHDVTLASSAKRVEEAQMLRTLLALDSLYSERTSICLVVVHPAEDGTGLIIQCEWIRPLFRLELSTGVCAVPAIDAMSESGLVGTAEGMDTEALSSAVAGGTKIKWRQSGHGS